MLGNLIRITFINLLLLAIMLTASLIVLLQTSWCWCSFARLLIVVRILWRNLVLRYTCVCRIIVPSTISLLLRIFYCTLAYAPSLILTAIIVVARSSRILTLYKTSSTSTSTSYALVDVTQVMDAFRRITVR